MRIGEVLYPLPFMRIEIGDAGVAGHTVRANVIRFVDNSTGEVLSEVTDHDKLWYQASIMDLFDLVACGEPVSDQLAMDALGDTGYVAQCECDKPLHVFDYERGFCRHCLMHVNG